MKVIDLLNKIANGEEVPKRIKYEDDIYIHIGNYCYYCDETNLILSDRLFAEHSKLNEEIEIIEENKKIEKLDLKQDNGNSNYYLLNEYGTKCGLTKHSKIIADKVNELVKAVNELKGKSE